MPSLYIIGEYFSHDDTRYNKPFSGAAGSILRKLLAQAGIDERDCIFDNVFNFHVGRYEQLMTRNKTEATTALPPFAPGKLLKAEHQKHITALKRRIEDAQPNLVLALGAFPLWAITHHTGIKRWRGSPLMSADGQFKVLATWHPNSIMRQWNLRPIVYMDMQKAERERHSRLLKRPRRILHLEPSLDDIASFYEDYIRPSSYLSTDIETKAGTITEIGFAPSQDRALVIPFWSRLAPDGNYWPSHSAEREAWDWVGRILREHKHVGQNFAYDMQYLSRTVGLPSGGFIGDTMLLHHTLQPELEKGLGFLGSVYTDEPSWKFMRTDHSTMKREDD